MRANLLATVALALISSAAMAQAPTPFSGVPLNVHIGQASCTFALRGDIPGAFQYFGVAFYNPDFGVADNATPSMCAAIVNAAPKSDGQGGQTPGQAIGWGVFPAGHVQTVPCDPNFCISSGAHFNTATRVTNIVLIPSIDF